MKFCLRMKPYNIILAMNKRMEAKNLVVKIVG